MDIALNYGMAKIHHNWVYIYIYTLHYASPLPKDSEEKLLGPECQAVLEALAQTWALDIAPLEARHASNREMSLLRSKGWVPSLETLSTQFICKAVSRASARGNTSLHGKNVKKAKTHEKKESQLRKKKNAGGGGAWRAYVHHKCKGEQFGGAALTELAKSYKALSPQEKQVYIDAGKAATLAKKEGFASFYEPEKSTQKKSQKQQRPYLLPGDVTESGAIVSEDVAMQFGLGPSLQYEGTDFRSTLPGQGQKSGVESLKLRVVFKVERMYRVKRGQLPQKSMDFVPAFFKVLQVTLLHID